MATLDELYKLRKIFRDYEAPIPEKLKQEIREKETPYLKELNEMYSSIAPKNLPVKELSEKVISSRLTAKNEKLKEREKIVQEIEELKRKLDSLYDDKFNGIISVESYTRLSSQTEKQISALNLRVYEIDNEDKQIREDAKEIIKYENQIKSLLNLDKPNRELIKTLVKEIYIDKDKNIEIKYRFKVLDDIKINYEDIK